MNQHSCTDYICWRFSMTLAKPLIIVMEWPQFFRQNFGRKFLKVKGILTFLKLETCCVPSLSWSCKPMHVKLHWRCRPLKVKSKFLKCFYFFFCGCCLGFVVIMFCFVLFSLLVGWGVGLSFFNLFLKFLCKLSEFCRIWNRK